MYGWLQIALLAASSLAGWLLGMVGKVILDMSWHNNAPLHFRLGQIAIWNRLIKRTINAKSDGVLTKLAEAAPALFKDLVEAPNPTTMEKNNGR